MDVIVISDDPNMLDWTKEALAFEGGRVDIILATTPERALRSLNEESYDIIISDHKMLKENNSALLEMISEKMEEPLVILKDKEREAVVRKAPSSEDLEEGYDEVLHSLLTHDLMNKLRLIKGDLQILKLEYDIPEEVEDHILTIEGRVNDSLKLVQRIGKLKEAKEKGTRDIDLISVLKNTIREMEGQMGGMELNMSIDDLDRYTVKAGPLLREVFLNIIKNSVEYSEGERVEIAVNECDEEVICSIEDNGEGIPEEKKELVFEKGYTSDNEGGSGLGLFIVKELLKHYGGSVEVKDSELGGAKFDVRLKKR